VHAEELTELGLCDAELLSDSFDFCGRHLFADASECTAKASRAPAPMAVKALPDRDCVAQCRRAWIGPRLGSGESR